MPRSPTTSLLDTGPPRSRAMSGSRAAAPRAVALLALVAVTGACASGHRSAHSTSPSSVPPAPPSSVTAAPTTVTTSSTTTTAAYQPTSPQSSPEAASDQLVQDWGDGDRTKAAAVAAPSAVASLFAVPYPGSSLDFRGCSGTFSPAVCSYRDGYSDNSPLIQVTTTQVPAGWYVSEVDVQT